MRDSYTVVNIVRSVATGLLWVATCILANPTQAMSDVESIYYYQKDGSYGYYQTLLNRALEITTPEYGAAYPPCTTRATTMPLRPAGYRC